MKHRPMRKRARRALSLLFALTLLWECGALTPKAQAADVVAADGTVNFVTWEKIYTMYSLRQSCSDGPHPILLSYKSNKTEYFICATKDNWRWEKNDYVLVGMPTIYDSRFDELRTVRNENKLGPYASIGTFNAPWAHFKGELDSKGNPKLVFNVSNGNDGPGEYLGPGKSYAGQTYGGHKVRDTCFVVRPEETTTWRFSDTNSGYRMWNRDYDGDDEDVIFHGSTVVLSDKEREGIASISVGTVVTASALTHDFTVQNDQATTMGRPISYIPEGVTLRVASGGVLTVSGYLVNDGKIVVEQGGLLVVRENSVIIPYHGKETACGGISSAGTVVVEKGGMIVGGGANGVYLTGGVVYNYGTIVSENFTATKKQLINNQKGAKVVAGRTLKASLQNGVIAYYLRYRSNAGRYDSDFMNCNLPYGRVNIADGAVYGDTRKYSNCGSFGEAGGMMKVFYHDDASAYEVLSAPRGTLGYQQSDTSHTVTRREVVYASGQIDTLRTQYEQTQNMKQTLPGKTNKEASLTVDTELTFEQYIEQYFRSRGIDLDEKVTVRDGVITTGGLSALTIPWNQRFSVVRESAKAAEQTPGLSTPVLYFVQRKCPAELGATLPLGG